MAKKILLENLSMQELIQLLLKKINSKSAQSIDEDNDEFDNDYKRWGWS